MTSAQRWLSSASLVDLMAPRASSSRVRRGKSQLPPRPRPLTDEPSVLISLPSVFFFELVSLLSACYRNHRRFLHVWQMTRFVVLMFYIARKVLRAFLESKKIVFQSADSRLFGLKCLLVDYRMRRKICTNFLQNLSFICLQCGIFILY